MILIKEGYGILEGSKNTLLNELSYLVHEMTYNSKGNFTKEEVEKAIANGFLTSEELEAKAKETKNKHEAELKKAKEELRKKFIESCEKCPKKDSCTPENREKEFNELAEELDDLAKDVARIIMESCGVDNNKKREEREDKNADDEVKDFLKGVFGDAFGDIL